MKFNLLSTCFFTSMKPLLGQESRAMAQGNPPKKADHPNKKSLHNLCKSFLSVFATSKGQFAQHFPQLFAQTVLCSFGWVFFMLGGFHRHEWFGNHGIRTHDIYVYIYIYIFIFERFLCRHIWPHIYIYIYIYIYMEDLIWLAKVLASRYQKVEGEKES